MNKYVLIFFSLISMAIGAQTPSSLRPGDVLLQPLYCWTCALIEAEEESIYSHMGVVLSVTPEILIGESFGVVKKLSLAEFAAKTEKGQKIKVLRFRNPKLAQHMQNSSAAFMKLFDQYFAGAAYDPEFLWNNFDESGREKLYCSEMIGKLFQYFVNIDPPIKRMRYRKNREHWLKYFNGNIPDGLWGNAPADFDRSELFYVVGEL